MNKLNALKKQERDSKDRIARLTWQIQSQQEDLEYIKRSMLDHSKKVIARRQKEEEQRQEKYEKIKTPSQQQTDSHNRRKAYLDERIIKENETPEQAAAKLKDAENTLEMKKREKLQQNGRLQSIHSGLKLKR